MSYASKRIREDLASIKGWIDIWKDDRALNLIPTAEGLEMAEYRVKCALDMLDELEGANAAFRELEAAIVERRP